MEVRKGYKDTEVGVIPSDWDVKSIRDVCRIFGRIGFRGYTINDIVDEGKGAITISPSNIEEGKTHFKNCTYISWFKYNESPEIKIFNGDILLVKTGSTFGKTAIVQNLPEKATINPQLVVLKYPQIDNCFLGYMMNFEIIQNQIVSNIVGGAIPTLSQELVYNFQIPLPPTHAEQERIATALSDTDVLITSLEKLIDKKRKIKQGAMQELLTGKKRLPGFSGKWEIKKLGEIARITMGQSPDSNYYNNKGDGIPLIQGNADIENRKSIKRIWTTQTTRTCDKDDLLMTVRAPVGEIGIATEYSCIGRGVCALGPKIINKDYLFYLLLLNENNWKMIEQGSTFTSANSLQINSFEILLSNSSEEQTRIAQIFSDMDTEIESLERKLEKYKLVKQGMMQELLTGKTRLLDVNIQAKIDSKIIPLKNEQKVPPHNREYNEAVVIAVLANTFSDKNFPLGRKRYTKLSYLLHRHCEHKAEGYLKKAAGPYNPATKYGGSEKIALTKKYVIRHSRDNFSGFISGENIQEAIGYFDKWYGKESLKWLEQFRYKKNDELELLTTVDMAVQELYENKSRVSVESVKEVIHNSPEWLPKLDRELFSDENIDRAIITSEKLFAM
jgi:type I restriction enzyme, S subunit